MQDHQDKSTPKLAVFSADDQSRFIEDLLQRQDDAIAQLDDLDSQVLAAIELCAIQRTSQPAA